MSGLHVIRHIVDPTTAPEKTALHWLNTVTKEAFYSVGTDTVDDWVNYATLGDLIAATETVQFSARVNEAGGIIKGEVVYISGVTGGAMEVSLASNDVFAESDVIAISAATTANNGTMVCQNFGLLEKIDTSSFTTGDILYLGVSGAITNSHPAGLDSVMRLGYAIKINASTGSIFIDIAHQTIANDHNGTVRFQLVNENSGNLAGCAFTLVNDLGHFGGVTLGGSNNLGVPDQFNIYNEGYGDTNFSQNGNHDFVFYTDTTDSHNTANLIAKMKLEAAGKLLIDKIEALTLNGDLVISPNGTGDILIGSRNIVADGTKLDTIETNATADQDLTLEDTQANILASTPTVDVIARATDTEEVFLWDASKTQWYQFSNYFDERGTSPDIGLLQDSNRRGYGGDYVVDKTLNNVRFGGTSQELEGAPRVNAGVFQIYLNGTWQDIVTNFRFREDPTGGYELEHKPIGFTKWIEVRSGNSNDLDPNGRPLIQSYKTSMGAYQVPTIMNGGTF